MSESITGGSQNCLETGAITVHMGNKMALFVDPVTWKIIGGIRVSGMQARTIHRADIHKHISGEQALQIIKFAQSTRKREEMAGVDEGEATETSNGYGEIEHTFESNESVHGKTKP